MLTQRFDQALTLAHTWHNSQKRKGSQTPYIAHLLAVSALVLEHGGSEDEAIAGLLHDALEDAPNQEEAEARRAEIFDRYGAEVLSVVEACTDADPTEKRAENALEGDARRAQWRVRKTAYVNHFEGAPGSVLLVAAADKVHNAHSIVRDVSVHGPKVFDRFVGRADGTLWYYRAVLRALGARVDGEPRITGLVLELKRLVGEMGG